MEDDTLNAAIRKGYDLYTDTEEERRISEIEWQVNQWMIRQTQREMQQS